MAERIAHFEILAKLGQGGMGVVFKAHDTKLLRAVALKLLPPEYVGDAARRSRFIREARSAAAVAHANIATIYEIGEDEAGHVFIAMELVEGESLRDKLVREGRLGLAEALHIARRIARGLSKAHERRVIHRDLKPDNVMLTSEGEVKILDFGLAKLRAQPTQTRSMLENAATDEHPTLAAGAAAPPAPMELHLTEAGHILGTPGYMAPEQAASEPVDARTDLFALGVVLYEMLTGMLPFRGKTPLAYIAALACDEPQSIEELVPEVPRSVREIVSRCLAKKPSDRFVDARELIGAIDESESVVAELASLRTARGRVARTASPAAIVTSTSATERSLDAPARSRGGLPYRAALVGVAVVSAVALLCAVSAVVVLRRPRSPPVAATSASGGTAASGTRLLDLPAPKQCNAAASAEVRMALEAIRGRGFESGEAHFEAAIAADPSCAEAHLRLAVSSQFSATATVARQRYARAALLRERLGERDRLLLEAFEPLFAREPADAPQMLARLIELTRRYPRDAELLVLTSLYSSSSDDPEQMRTHAQRATEVDPGYSDAWQLLGLANIKAEKYEEASSVLAKCEESVPTSADCVYEEMRLAQWLGRCAEMEARSRTYVARSSGEGDAYLMLAVALASNGGSREAVGEALRQYGSRLPPERAHLVMLEEARLAVVHGDFEAAEESLAKMQHALDASVSRAEHAAHAQLLLELRLETGKTKEAIKIAEAFVSRQRAWSGTLIEGFDRFARRGLLLVPRMLSVRSHAGRLTAQQRDDELAGWLSTRRELTSAQPMRWVAEQAVFVETPAEAAKALATMPKEATDPHPGHARLALMHGMPSALLGRVLLLGGRPSEAIAPLQGAAHRCDTLEEPLSQTQARLWLGQALEATGQPKEACAEYTIVRQRWAAAKPRSISARKADERMRALSCAGKR